ncbi:RAMP superfamily CRISPR-associated protein [Desulfobacter latus]|uniref:CRISPR-associated protein n=1 Tax=Desulfobacter latus TaxID=2292 RepID=A0A850SWT8_9BACT|nr:RAMP superfamily CRISPR-associated protein [Desulfobacter latus]NWH03873.1 CRISPR-associated protein [Desulfobacter latus]
MTTMNCKIDFFSNWHAGSGMSAGMDIDTLVLKDRDNLPYIPGKTIKGLLKDSALTLKAFATDTATWAAFVKTCFGGENSSGETRSGLCRFSNAELTLHLKQAIIKDQTTGFLYQKIAATAIDDNGIAKEKSLRKIETTIPLSLFFTITNLPDDYLENIKDCLAFTRRMGLGRNRGLGRCRCSIQDKGGEN